MAGSDPITLASIKQIAKERLPNSVWDYYITGSDEERTAERNEAIYNKVLLRPRVLRDVSAVDTSTTIFGKRYTIPIAIAPSAYQRLVGSGGELGNGRPSPWFQLYFLGSRDISKKLITRAEEAGYEALVLTVDTTVMGNRLHERRHPLQLPPDLSMANLSGIKGGGSSKGRLLLNARTAAEAREITEQYAEGLVDRGLTWDEVVPWIRAQTKMKIIVKGIMTAEDASQAVKSGVDGVIVSNHGGRQLDGVPSTLEVLPEIVEAVSGRIPVIFDGGITRGSDVFKALALGADLCLVGRTALWGLAYDGQRGVETVLHILERELWRTMSLMGARSIKDISRSMLGRERQDGFGIAKL